MTKHSIHISNGKKVFFLSDHHFGLDTNVNTSSERERKFVKWLDTVKSQAEAIFILGDMFDFWYEYRRAVPKGFVRVLGKLAELTDAGISIYYFTGNHDMWMLDYLTKELNIEIFFNPEEFTIQNKTFLIGHGDGLGPSDKNFKRLKKLFTNKFAQWSFRWLHPDIGLRLVKYLSQKNKLMSGVYDYKFRGKDREWLFIYSKNYYNTRKRMDYFVFGHRHVPLNLPINDHSTYYNTGDWLFHFTYIEFDGDKMVQKKYDE